jgi:predicted DCC family thiol-disulfide oxidoreductase YuxK
MVHDGRVDRSTFLYDGDCSFCSSCARFIERHIRTNIAIMPWQFADLDRLGLTAVQCEEAVQFVPAMPSLAGPVASAGPVALGELLRASSGVTGRLLWRPAGHLLRMRPILALAWPVYRWIARNRHRMPGGTAACALPTDHPARRT